MSSHKWHSPIPKKYEQSGTNNKKQSNEIPNYIWLNYDNIQGAKCVIADEKNAIVTNKVK